MSGTRNYKVFWNRWASRYDRVMSGSKDTYLRIAEQINHTLNRNMTVLELACGTGILSVRIAASTKHLEATDFSEEMIWQAKRKHHSSRLHFSVQDAADLPYASESFDAVVIANALHVVPNAELVLKNIRRVLKKDGILIAPTFTAAGTFRGRLKIRIMGLSGFKVFRKWSQETYLAFLEENGFTVIRSEIFKGPLQLTYAEARIRKS